LNLNENKINGSYTWLDSDSLNLFLVWEYVSKRKYVGPVWLSGYDRDNIWYRAG